MAKEGPKGCEVKAASTALVSKGDTCGSPWVGPFWVNIKYTKQRLIFREQNILSFALKREKNDVGDAGERKHAVRGRNVQFLQERPGVIKSTISID